MSSKMIHAPAGAGHSELNNLPPWMQVTGSRSTDVLNQVAIDCGLPPLYVPGSTIVEVVTIDRSSGLLRLYTNADGQSRQAGS